ncbi:spore germination protein [Bacillus sp. AFS076308]|uniref:spore germination protein n=1 Tax=unclassified Bacillus (in: firmicutes) TaxID=185979 RepID=UPI000BF60CD6|nr:MULTISPECIES: spore germination protein [unclassified Bacillus (in: firmicutes)]PFN96142.1 spore germination protein [Bacillus sp. AFS076308]PGV56028.1 spore germination protein [Bacillus sp. AFS037270]
MFFKRRKLRDKEDKQAVTENSQDIEELFAKAKKSSDFKQFSLTDELGHLIISYYNTLIDQQQLQLKILLIFRETPFEQDKLGKIDDIKKIISIEDIVITDNVKEAESKLLKGYAILQMKENDQRFALILLSNDTAGLREQNNVENEYSVVGPLIGFVENIDVNIHLLRQQINTFDLITKEISVGSTSRTRIIIAYIEGITDEQHVNTITQRLQDIDFDIVYDTSQLHQLITGNSLTPFPLLLSTERVDRAAHALNMGQVAVFSNGSPYVITGPATLTDFFITPEDYFLPWIIASFFRLIRIFSVLFSIFATSIYIAVLTYHYEVIPNDLFGSLSFSRHNVPFPPVFEVVFLEFTIELLREAGVRLPTKVGQTLGIVGGIVIGQASVEASLTSNVLLIIVALSALASFTTPIYKMSNTIRFLRFPLIIAASIWGGLGIVMGIAFLIVHLTRLESLGTPYTVPFYPFRPQDLKDSIIRASYSETSKRPSYLRPKSIWRYHPNNHKKKKSDFDE